MIIRINNETWQYDNAGDTISSVFLNDLEKYLKEQDLYILKCDIDDEEFFDDFQNQLSKHFGSSVSISIHTTSLEGLLADNIKTLQEYLDRAIPMVKELADQIYQNLDNVWEQFGQLATGLDWINSLLVALRVHEKEHLNLESFSASLIHLEQSAGSLFEALEAKDSVLISDNVSYVILPLLENLHQAAGVYLQNGEMRDVVN